MLSFDHGPTELQVRHRIYMMASLHPTSLRSGEAALRYPPLPFATVEDDLYAARAPHQPEQLRVSVEARAGDLEEEPISDLVSAPR